jgi:hypothetical protein
MVYKTPPIYESQNIADRRSVFPPYWLSRSPRLPVFSSSESYYDNNRLFATQESAESRANLSSGIASGNRVVLAFVAGILDFSVSRFGNGVLFKMTNV